MMKIRFDCPVCESSKPSANTRILVELQDGLQYDIQCELGHNSVVSLANQKHEVLYELGCLALLDGYCREAVTGFWVAAERFHEFVLGVFAELNEVDRKEHLSLFKRIRRQSERQYGAYCFAMLNSIGAAPIDFHRTKLLDTKLTLDQLRNDCVHSGLIPSMTLARDSGRIIFEYINQTTLLLKNKCAGALLRARFYTQSELPKHSASSKLLATVINLAYAPQEIEKHSFNSRLGQLAMKRKIGLHSLVPNKHY